MTQILDITSDVKKVLGSLALLSGNMRRVTSNTLNSTSFQMARKDIPRILERDLDRPTPQTKKSGRFKKSTPSALKATVFFAPFAERYLLKTVTGGKTVDKPVPIELRLNRYGNIPSLKGSRKIKQLLARRDVFRGTINGLEAIWQRKGNKLIPLIGLNIDPVSRPRLRFASRMKRAAELRVPVNAVRELRRELRKRRLI